jgi:DNA repair exonuclease SbcCD nuclease subunit
MNLEKRYIVIGDNHWGKKQFSKDLFESQLSLYKKQIIPYMQENNIKTIIHLGDLFDNRILIDISFLNDFIDKFLKLLEENDITFITIVGNHDIYYKNTLDVSMIKYLDKFYNKIIVIDKIISVNGITFMPWIINNKDIPDDREKIIIGHFEFKNIDPHFDGDLDPKIFNEADLVISGHYHNSSKNKNILYAGTPYQLSFGEFGEVKGFYELDMRDSMEFKFIPNTINKMFLKVHYNNGEIVLKGIGEDKIFYKETINELIEILNENIFKFIIDNSKNKKHNEIIYTLKENNLEFEIINNITLNEIMESVKDEPKTEVDSNLKGIEIILDRVPNKYKKIVQEIQNFSLKSK